LEESGQLHAPAALTPGKESLVPIGEEAGEKYSAFKNRCIPWKKLMLMIF
jgi:hypothetical protein